MSTGFYDVTHTTITSAIPSVRTLVSRWCEGDERSASTLSAGISLLCSNACQHNMHIQHGSEPKACCCCRTCRDRLLDHNTQRRKRMAEAPVAAVPLDVAALWQSMPTDAAISRANRAFQQLPAFPTGVIMQRA